MENVAGGGLDWESILDAPAPPITLLGGGSDEKELNLDEMAMVAGGAKNKNKHKNKNTDADDGANFISKVSKINVSGIL